MISHTEPHPAGAWSGEASGAPDAASVPAVLQVRAAGNEVPAAGESLICAFTRPGAMNRQAEEVDKEKVRMKVTASFRRLLMHARGLLATSGWKFVCFACTKREWGMRERYPQVSVHCANTNLRATQVAKYSE